ncbi:MAG: Alpha-amylase 1 [bacterium ADurb.Bin429]|nr:MAG: Alpha-amylase 1 [bacterium ADurb.Bin429]
MIPERDRRGQLTLLSEWVTALFGRRPTGAWLAERVWEPSLPTALHAAGLDYVLIDDEVFHHQGYTEQETCVAFITEEQGDPVRVLPISRRLRYAIPTLTVMEVMATLGEMTAAQPEVIIYAEDGERFGNWPGTYDYLYGEEAYLDQLFSAIEASDDVTSVLPGDYLRQSGVSKRVYLPPTSYQEMLEWSGGNWRNFLTQYRESNLMHKKMYQVSRWVAAAQNAGHDTTAAQRNLYAAQCNCAYWYGTFGGLYLPHLRRAVYQHLLRAEYAVAPLLPADARPSAQVIDHDYDGRDEVYLRAGEISVGIAPAQGGAVFALEHLGLAHNFMNTMSRYPLRPEKDTREDIPALPVDWHPRFAFVDHLLSPATTAEDMPRGTYGEQGDFVLGVYDFTLDRTTLRLWRDGHFWDGQDFVPLRVDKVYSLIGNDLRVAYRVTNHSDRERALRFAVEMHIQLTAGDAPGRRLTLLHGDKSTEVALEKVTCAEANGALCEDAWLQGTLAFDWEDVTESWIYPIHTPLRSLAGLEWVYQSTVVLPVWTLQLAAGASWTTQLSLSATYIEPTDTLASARVDALR